MKFDFIQTLGKYKSFELSQSETASGKFKAQLSTGEEGKSRMILTCGNATGDIRIGDWTFSKVIDIIRQNNLSSNYLIEGIKPDGNEFSYHKSFYHENMKATDIPVNYILLVAALNDLDKAAFVLESMSKKIPYQVSSVELELDKLYPLLETIKTVSANYYFDQTFKDWMTRTVSGRIAMLENYLEKNKEMNQ